MATTSADYAGFAGTTYPADTFDEIVRALQGIAALFNAKITTGTEPDDHLQYIEFGDAAAHNDFRFGYDGTNIVFQLNSGTEGTPAWTTIHQIALVTGNVTQLSGTYTLQNGDLNLSSNDITNVGTINSIDIATHATRHQPGGSDAFTFATPSDVASANAAGSATSFVRGDHAHRGVRSFNTAFGDVTVSSSTGITVSGTSATTISSDLRVYAYADNTSPGPITLSATTNTAIGGFSNLAFPGSDGAADYLVRFTGSLTTTVGAAETLFNIHVGTNGDVTDTIVSHCSVETAASGDPGIVLLEALVLNASSSARITVSYDNTAGGDHVLEGGTDGRPILTVTRLTGVTTH